ncbi:MAG TPA: VWA domain-containing protein, partial [Candidatus Angelobacter sp.]|nr:VWA domain-containing protein [Candidatus Angelobacter sp.]
MFRSTRGTISLVCALIAFAVLALAQQSLPDGPKPKDQTQQTIPDAPKPKPQSQQGQFPQDAPPAPKNSHEATPTPTPTPAGPANNSGVVMDRSQLPTMSIRVNFVVVPATVKDSSGRLVAGLTSNDFKVYEEGELQQLRFFTADAFPLSAAIVIATNLPSTTMKKVNESLPALIGAFSQYDEVALYRYDHTVSQVAGYTGAGSVPTAALNRIKKPGREGGPPMVGGPFGGGPSINGHPVNDPNATGGRSSEVQTAPREFYVLNDAILRAAQDLARRDRSRRRIIFVISDGREQGSSAGYDEVKRILQSNNIAVYGVGVDQASIPIYDKLNRVRLPGFGSG